jgi:hypothetical protein
MPYSLVERAEHSVDTGRDAARAATVVQRPVESVLARAGAFGSP